MTASRCCTSAATQPACLAGEPHRGTLCLAVRMTSSRCRQLCITLILLNTKLVAGSTKAAARSVTGYRKQLHQLTLVVAPVPCAVWCGTGWCAARWRSSTARASWC
jgi:hypothetical protein